MLSENFKARKNDRMTDGVERSCVFQKDKNVEITRESEGRKSFVTARTAVPAGSQIGMNQTD